MTLGEKLRTLRQRKKLSQAELAQTSGIYQKSISRYELGEAVPSATALKQLADALDVTADYLLSEKPVVVRDKDLLKKFEVIQDLDEPTKQVVLLFLDLVVRDFKARQAYEA